MSLNRNQLKYLVIVAMVIDHIAAAFLSNDSAITVIMRMIGRLTAPTMAFFIVEGYFHTKNKKKYALRLFIFSLISWLPYSYFEYGKATFHFSVIFTLFLGLMIVWLLDSKINAGYKIFGIVLILFFSFLADWMIFVPLWCISFLALERNKKAIGYGLYLATAILYSYLVIKTSPAWTGIWAIGVFFVLPMIKLFYHGESGSKKAFHKWFFYAFYPVHLLLLLRVKCVIDL